MNNEQRTYIHWKDYPKWVYSNRIAFCGDMDYKHSKLGTYKASRDFLPRLHIHRVCKTLQSSPRKQKSFNINFYVRR